MTYTCECKKDIELSPSEMYIYNHAYWYSDMNRKKNPVNPVSWCDTCNKSYRGRKDWHKVKCGLDV